MPTQDKRPKTFLDTIRPWIHGEQISIYLEGRIKPVTGVTVCSVSADVLIGRWNSSTHLIPLDKILYVRFAPDSDPCRRPEHPLHNTVQSHRPRDSRWQPPAKPYRQTNADGVVVGDIIKDLIPSKEDQTHAT